MPSPTMPTAAQFVRLVGLPDAPTIIDVRTDEDHAADPRMLPGASRRDFRTVVSWAREYAGHRHVVVVCQQGLSAVFADHPEMLRHGMVVYDAWRRAQTGTAA